MQVLYFYGFASGPLSNKAQFFRQKFQSVNYPFQIIDYIPTSDAFSRLQVSKVIKKVHTQIKDMIQDEQIILMGSSFGGMIATWYTHLFPEIVNKLVLMAPALQFSADFIVKSLETTQEKWKDEKYVLVEHYRFNQSIPLNYSFYTDLKANPIPEFSQNKFPVFTIIFHGEYDDVVPLYWSKGFAKNNAKVTLYSLNSDHQLLDQRELIWEKIRSFLVT